MNRIDELIGEALSEEDRDLLARHAEPGYVSQAFGIFRGRLAWVMWLAYLLTIVAFAGAAYALWQMTVIDEVVPALRWGVGAVILFQVVTMLKGFMGNQLEANRVLRELKRMELQLALLREGGRP